MFPSELQLQSQRNEMLRQAEQHRLLRLVTENRPTLWQRLRARIDPNTTEAASVTNQARQPIQGHLKDRSRAFN